MYRKSILINNVSIEASKDTGIIVNVIYKKVHENLGSPTLKLFIINLIGFGGNRVCPLIISKQIFKVMLINFFSNVYVSPERVLKKSIIGQELLKQVELTIKESKISVNRLNAMYVLQINAIAGTELNIGKKVT